MNCVVTGKVTKCKTNNIPLSCEGRSLLESIVESHNEKIFKVYKEKNKEANNGLDLDDDTLRNFSPKLNKTEVLKLLSKHESDILETRDEILGA